MGSIRIGHDGIQRRCPLIRNLNLRTYARLLLALAIMIVGLMALGAGVRTMNAGLSCPDWPLCFGKVIPDFHVGVWFEFVHRAYAGIVAILFIVGFVIAHRNPEVPKAVRTAAKWAGVFLTCQIVMGGLTVLLLVKAVVVTAHLLLATLFFGCVLWMYFSVSQKVNTVGGVAPETLMPTLMPKWIRICGHVFPLLVFLQIAIGGLVASTYAGSVCVDWPLCNGQWVPTWSGAIGLQIVHRLFAYALAVLFLLAATIGWRTRVDSSQFVTKILIANGCLVLIQIAIGVANLLLFIPPHITVAHQSVAIVILAINLRLLFEVRILDLAKK
jgi:cytochrome c oxidase assembly protein subunit 15